MTEIAGNIENPTIERTGKMFTSGQLFGITFFGGPFALLYAITTNIASFGNQNLGKNILLFGTIILMTSLSIIFYHYNTPELGKGIQMLSLLTCAFFGIDSYKAKISGFLANGGEKASFWDEVKAVLFGIVMMLIVIIFCIAPFVFGLVWGK